MLSKLQKGNKCPHGIHNAATPQSQKGRWEKEARYLSTVLYYQGWHSCGGQEDRVLLYTVEVNDMGRQFACTMPWTLQRVNASTIFCWLLDALELVWYLAEAFVLPFSRQRSIFGLSKKTKMKLSFLLGMPLDYAGNGQRTPLMTSAGQRRRCHCCLYEVSGRWG